jgi:GT2 family glycosyltransferase
MNIHLIVVAYGIADELVALFEAATSEKHEVVWHLFLHSQNPQVVEVCETFCQRGGRAVCYYPYGVNRGLAKSYNEGILAAFEGGADVVILSNDDIVPGDGDLDRLAEAAFEMKADSSIYAVECAGFDRRMNRRCSMGSGFFALLPAAVETIGMYDENFFPMYWEDIDYKRRAALAGLRAGYVEDTKVIHEGSKSIHTVAGLMEQHEKTFHRNRLYYEAKWGGAADDERFTRPFNAFGLRIAPGTRHHPYGGYDRTDQAIVRM